MVIVCPLVMTAKTSLQMEEEEIDGAVLLCSGFIRLSWMCKRTKSSVLVLHLFFSLHFVSGGVSAARNKTGL